jgi:shikimate 5-dehydrogenase
MNKGNTIGMATKLYGFISEYAQQNRFSVVLNSLFRADGINMMMIPMNIREDDIYFTVSNMKKSHVNGAMIGDEYRDAVIELLDESSDFVDKTGFCDFVNSDNGILKPLIITPYAIIEKLKALHVKKIAIIGSSPLAYALSLTLNEFDCSFYDEHIEDLMNLSQKVGVDIDINRIAEDIELDLSEYDIVIDTSFMKDYSIIKALPNYVMSLHVSEPKELKTLALNLGAEFIDYEMMLEYLSKTAYKILTKEYKNEY